ncbi:MAG: DUF2203 domain-containing protein [Planctomycetes bacterium]|nr:DUF2203 domain-containing protein [Planctomycetota bacterium]
MTDRPSDKPSPEASPLHANQPRLFTVEQANAMLPLVRAIVGDLAQLSREFRERKQRVGELIEAHGSKRETVYSDELHEAELQLERDRAKIQEYVDELLALGVEPKGGPEGLVDFPAAIDGRVVYLCWKLGEPEVLHWHELDAGFAGRRSLVASSGTGGTFGENSLGC